MAGARPLNFLQTIVNKVIKFTSSYNNDMILLLQNKLELKLHKILHRYICVFCMCTFVSIWWRIFIYLVGIYFAIRNHPTFGIAEQVDPTSFLVHISLLDVKMICRSLKLYLQSSQTNGICFNFKLPIQFVLLLSI